MPGADDMWMLSLSVSAQIAIGSLLKRVYGDKMSGGSPAWSWRAAATTQTTFAVWTVLTVTMSSSSGSWREWGQAEWDPNSPSYVYERIYICIILGYFAKDFIMCPMPPEIWAHHIACTGAQMLPLVGVLDKGHNLSQLGSCVLELGSLGMCLVQLYPESAAINPKRSSRSLQIWRAS